MKNNFLLFIIFIISLLLFNSNCSKEKTELDLIKDNLKRIAKNAENKNIDDFLLYISENYKDSKGRKKDDIRPIIETYINKYKGIVVNILEVRAIEIKPLEALIETDVALSSGIARALRKVTNISSRYYQFQVKLVKESTIWMLVSVEWKYISKSELSDESLNILSNILD